MSNGEDVGCSHPELAGFPQVDVLALTEGGAGAVLMHRGEAYLLRITRHQRLILTMPKPADAAKGPASRDEDETP